MSCFSCRFLLVFGPSSVVQTGCASLCPVLVSAEVFPRVEILASDRLHGSNVHCSQLLLTTFPKDWLNLDMWQRLPEWRDNAAYPFRCVSSWPVSFPCPYQPVSLPWWCVSFVLVQTHREGWIFPSALTVFFLLFLTRSADLWEMCLKSLHLVSSLSYTNKAMLLSKSAKLWLHQVHSYHSKHFKLIFHGQLKCSEDLRN